jgi:hopanoid biosynthesis associated RND transporter like protein HpnN
MQPDDRCYFLDRLPDFVLKRAWSILAAALLLTIGLAVYSVSHFSIDTDFDALISSNIPSQRHLRDFEKRFPQLDDSLVVLVEAKTPEEAEYARDFLADRLRGHPTVFRSVFVPGGGRFYQKNGLLYLSANRLNDLSDRLAEVQPFLGLLSRDFTLNNLFATMAEIVPKSAGLHGSKKFDTLLGQMADTMEKAVAGETDWLSWQALMSDEPQPGPHRGLIIVRPYLDKSALNPIRTATATIKSAESALRAAGFTDVSVGTTGELALKVANLNSVEESIGLATAASFVLVAVLLFAALQSLWLICICLAVLVAGLICTLGFAMAAIGRLNIMSATFVVLFIGLGIDYSIQYCLRYMELVRGGCSRDQAIRLTTREVGKALFLCAMTTAIGFYAFVPTAYAGASELGLISGTGIFILFAANLTVLPALLHVRPPSFMSRASGKVYRWQRLTVLPKRFSRAIITLSVLACIAGAASTPWIYFDFNPLNLNAPGSEAVQTAKKLLQSPETSYWTMSVMTRDAQDAHDVARRLKKLPVVKETLSIFDMVPANQAEKIETIQDMALFLPRIPEGPLVAPTSPERTMAALKSLRNALSETSVLSHFPSAQRLIRAIDQILSLSGQEKSIDPVLGRLTTATLLPLKRLLVQLNGLMNPERVTIKNLPPQLVEDFVSGGQYRVQVFPSRNLDHLSTMKRFVNDVQRVAPRATGSPAGIVGAGKTISEAFLQAFLTALAAILILLAIMTRNTRKVALIIFPLLVGLGMTIGTTVLLGIPFNFANIIVLPLLLGIGIDYPVHLVQRYAEDPSARGDILRTSTAKGILFSALTTMVSFSSLSFSSHQGMAGMGVMLTLCITFMIAATLVLLPAVLYLFSKR